MTVDSYKTQPGVVLVARLSRFKLQLPPLSHWVALVKLFNLPVPQCAHLQYEMIVEATSWGLVSELNEFMYVYARTFSAISNYCFIVVIYNIHENITKTLSPNISAKEENFFAIGGTG